MKKDFDEWNSEKKKVEEYHRAPVKTGEVYWCRIGLNIDVEQDGKGDNFMRPVIILKKFSDQIVLVIPLTTKNHKGDWYIDLSIDNKDVQGVLNQIRPIDTKRLLSSMGQIGRTEVTKIITAYYEIIKK